MRRPLRSLLAIGTLLACSGCGTSIDYDRALIELAAGSGAMEVAVRDARATAATDPTWLGVARSTLYIPFDVHTSSGRPFAQDVTIALCHALTEAGVDPTPVAVPFGATRQDVLVGNRSSARLLLLEFTHWSGDGYFGSVTVTYRGRASLWVGGEEVSAAEAEGVEEVDYRALGYATACRQVFTRVLGGLLARTPLEEEAEPPAAEPERPAVCPCGKALQPEWNACPFCGRKR